MRYRHMVKHVKTGRILSVHKTRRSAHRASLVARACDVVSASIDIPTFEHPIEPLSEGLTWCLVWDNPRILWGDCITRNVHTRAAGNQEFAYLHDFGPNLVQAKAIEGFLASDSGQQLFFGCFEDDDFTPIKNACLSLTSKVQFFWEAEDWILDLDEIETEAEVRRLVNEACEAGTHLCIKRTLRVWHEMRFPMKGDDDATT